MLDKKAHAPRICAGAYMGSALARIDNRAASGAADCRRLQSYLGLAAWMLLRSVTVANIRSRMPPNPLSASHFST